jgi:hypothetical protein
MRARLVAAVSVMFATAIVGAGTGAGEAATLRCEWSASGEAGEAILAFDLDEATRATSRPAPSWMPARIEGEGEASDHFARPALALDFRVGADGALTGPTRANVLISRYSDRDVGAAPKLSQVQVRAIADGAEAAMAPSWSPADAAEGEAGLARLIREAPPARLTLQVRDAQGRVLASASFRIGDLGEMRRLAGEARAGLEARMAAMDASAKGCP